jgi:NAD(P)-dependent dehydrogenase (short-subunit alcohol dehydrogenase family)
MPDLDGRVAVVTGGAGAIGRATCACLSEHGAKVVVADLRRSEAERVAEELEGEAMGVEHDVRDSASGVALAARATEVFGRVDILVNNAGVNSPTRAATDTVDEEWDRVMDTNARGTFVTTRAFLPGMVEQGRGRIINLSSIVGQLAFLASDRARHITGAAFNVDGGIRMH